jgi:ribosome-associated toxin RatA of RatAB toxin-antitoxin module
MTTRLQSRVAAPPAAIYALVQDIARWPRLLPHYRSVTVVSEAATRRLAVMRARRSWLRIRWTAEQRLDPTRLRIEFTHCGGLARGMRVAWTFEPEADATIVTLTHDVSALSVPLVRTSLGRYIVAHWFVTPIARQTMRHMKRLAESRHA